MKCVKSNLQNRINVSMCLSPRSCHLLENQDVDIEFHLKISLLLINSFVRNVI